MSNSISCDLTVFGNKDLQVRHEETSLSIIRSNEGIKELPDGYAFSYSYTPERFTALSQWITNESKCCPFFTFSLQLTPTNNVNKIWLEIRGSSEIKNFMEINFKSILDIDLTAFKNPAFV